MTYVLGLTGSIGMGKSTTAQMFRDLGVPVWDADATVHRLYAAGGAAVGPVTALCPAALAKDGSIDRPALRAAIAQEPGLLDRINAAVHPLVGRDREAFLQSTSAPLVVLDVPLLYEGEGAKHCDGVAVVSVEPAVQRARVLGRGMSPEHFEMILARQVPDSEKRARADFVLRTDTLEETRAQVHALVRRLSGRAGDA